MARHCRLCLGENLVDKEKNIFGTKLSRCKEPLVDILYWMFAIEVDVTDPYPKEVCQECLIVIEYVLEIKNTFKRNEEILKMRHDASIKDIPKSPSANLQHVQTLHTFDNSSDEKIGTISDPINKDPLKIMKDQDIQRENALKQNESTSLQNTRNTESLPLKLLKNSKKKNDEDFVSSQNKDFITSSSSKVQSAVKNAKGKKILKEKMDSSRPKTVKRTPTFHTLQKFGKVTEGKMLKSSTKSMNTNPNRSAYVLAEPMKYLITRERYKQINKFVYIKNSKFNELQNSCDSSHNSFFKVANMPNLYICKLCSRSFLSQTALNLHCKRSHELSDQLQQSNDALKNSKLVRKKQDSDSEVSNNDSSSDHNDASKSEVSIDNKENANCLQDHIGVFSLGLKRTTMPNYNQSRRKKHKTPTELHNYRKKESVVGSSKSAALSSKLKNEWEKQRLGTYSDMKCYTPYENDNSNRVEAKNTDDKRTQHLNITIKNLESRLENTINLNI